MSENRFTF